MAAPARSGRRGCPRACISCNRNRAPGRAAHAGDHGNLLGGKAGRTAADRARGIDPRPVAPRTLPPPPPSGMSSTAMLWTVPPPAPPSWTWSSSSDISCAGANRPPAP
ncbi:hypothetical protein GCM10010121_087400 [Streptomyces brasiliensis]|uniref:Uncharacterized protein n=1 Tax=Streptomyces brasiliensis TaxID=1954 RepID=A0A917P607_9ACTN|nr:hypothetical protein GCM10010121_087400 [Streptomyces brasiliensis]